MGANAYTLEGRHLTHAFGQGNTSTPVLRDVSLDVSPSELTLTMGPSGSGKSTLLAVLSGLLKPDGGTVVGLGKDLWRLSPAARKNFRLRHCGFIFQGYNLFPALTAHQQLEMVLRLGGATPARETRRRVDEMLALLGLAGKGRLRPAELSGGEKQRVAIGRALIKEPALCFADEPTSALDWEHGKQVVELLRAAARSRRASVLVVAHDPRLISYADRVFHLNDGQLVHPEADAARSGRGLS